MGEALGFGAGLGALLGSTTFIFQGEPGGIAFGAGFGIVYGLIFGLGGWLMGWLLYHTGLVARKGAALGRGVVVAAVAYPVIMWLLGGTLDPFVILIPAGVAAVVGLLRGRKYDAVLTGQTSVESSP